ncbi:MAG: hypothetical protein RRY54_04235 [Angelakisella sp.]
MNQLKNILARLKNPSVVISIASQIISVLLLLNVNVDRGIITAVITAACSVLVLLGIMSNPDTVTKGYGDDMHECANCHQMTPHLRVGDSLVCSKCGTVHS